MTKQKRRPKGENIIIVGDFSLRSLLMRRMREITIHADSLSPIPCTSLDPNHGYPFTFFLMNSTILKTNIA